MERIHVLELRSVRGTGGGPEKTILLGAERADPRVAVTVCYVRDADDPEFAIAERAARHGVRYVEVRERGSFDRRVWTRLRQIVQEHAIDIVHGHDYKTNLLALLLSWSDGIIPLSTAHGWTGHSRRERLVYYAMDKQILRAFPVTIAVSTEIGSELVRHRVRPDRVRVVVNGIDHRAFARDRRLEGSVRAALNLTSTDVVIGAIGRLEPQKRFDLLIQACARLRATFPRLRLVIAGAGSLHPDLKALAARLLPARACSLLGHRDDITPLHHAFDVFVQSSDYEGTPNAVLEAMALETPLVATRAGGTADIVTDGLEGLLVPCGSEAGLAAAIERILTDPGAARERAVRARRRVETGLSFDRRLETVERIYFELAARFPRRHARRAAEQCA